MSGELNSVPDGIVLDMSYREWCQLVREKIEDVGCPVEEHEFPQWCELLKAMMPHVRVAPPDANCYLEVDDDIEQQVVEEDELDARAVARIAEVAPKLSQRRDAWFLCACDDAVYGTGVSDIVVFPVAHVNRYWFVPGSSMPGVRGYVMLGHSGEIIGIAPVLIGMGTVEAIRQVARKSHKGLVFVVHNSFELRTGFLVEQAYTALSEAFHSPAQDVIDKYVSAADHKSQRVANVQYPYGYCYLALCQLSSVVRVQEKYGFMPVASDLLKGFETGEIGFSNQVSHLLLEIVVDDGVAHVKSTRPGLGMSEEKMLQVLGSAGLEIAGESGIDWLDELRRTMSENERGNSTMESEGSVLICEEDYLICPVERKPKKKAKRVRPEVEDRSEARFKGEKPGAGNVFDFPSKETRMSMVGRSAHGLDLRVLTACYAEEGEIESKIEEYFRFKSKKAYISRHCPEVDTTGLDDAGCAELFESMYFGEFRAKYLRWVLGRTELGADPEPSVLTMASQLRSTVLDVLGFTRDRQSASSSGSGNSHTSVAMVSSRRLLADMCTRIVMLKECEKTAMVSLGNLRDLPASVQDDVYERKACSPEMAAYREHVRSAFGALFGNSGKGWNRLVLMRASSVLYLLTSSAGWLGANRVELEQVGVGYIKVRICEYVILVPVPVGYVKDLELQPCRCLMCGLQHWVVGDKKGAVPIANCGRDQQEQEFEEYFVSLLQNVRNWSTVRDAVDGH